MAKKGGKGRKGGGGGGGGAGPKQRKYERDNKGRFASTGTGATARGGRLLTAKGNKRKTQTITATGQKGVLAKPKGLKPGAIKLKAAAKPATATPKAKSPKFTTEQSGRVRRAALGGGRTAIVRKNSAVIINAKGEPIMTRKGLPNITAGKKYAANPNARGPRLMGRDRSEASPSRGYIRTSKPTGTIGKPKGLKPESTNKLKTGIFISKRRAVNAQLANKPDQAVVNIPGRFTGRAGKSFDASITRAVATVKASKDAKFKTKAEVKADQAKAKAAKEAKPKRIRSAESLRVSRAKQIEKRRSITTNPAGVRASAAAKMAANATRTQQRAAAFYKAGAKPAAAAKPKRATRKNARTPDAAKVSRMAARFQAKGAAPESTSKVKRLNTIETRQKAIAFLAKPNSKGGDQVAAIAQNIANRKTYTTQTPSRNKPLARANLGQKTIRERERLSAQGGATTKKQAIEKSTQRQASAPKEPTTTRAKAAEVQRINNAANRRKAANAAKAAANEVKYFRKDSDSQAYKNALAKRDKTLTLRSPGTNKISFRSRRMAVSAQRQRINNMVESVNLTEGRKRGQGVRRSSTGMTQLGLMGPGKKLFRVRKVTGIQRPSGSKFKRSISKR